MLNPFHVMIIALILDNFCITGDGLGNLEKSMRKLINNEILTYIYQKNKILKLYHNSYFDPISSFIVLLF